MLENKYMSREALYTELERILGKRPSESTIRRWQSRAVNPFPRPRPVIGSTVYIRKEVETWFAKETA